MDLNEPKAYLTCHFDTT